MKFVISETEGSWGNVENIRKLVGTTVNIESIEDLKKIYDDVDCELIIDFWNEKIEIYNGLRE